ncbi:MAG TPA: metalloregulator ArsR/SmtB family transcription factor [Elusimicrobiota bacterium]|nr:metalloregulator ArsR/SmtB family transcription factor [Elusimicrobiota bacterium]
MVHIRKDGAAARLSAMADPLRLRILRLLLERELCVCEIVRTLEQPQYKISRHLTVMKRAGLVNDWREGTWAHYEINSSLSDHWRRALAVLGRAWEESPLVQKDLRRLRGAAGRKPGESARSRA